MEKEYFTVKDVAKRFKVTEQFIRAEIGRGKLHANLIGREYRVSLQDIEEYEKRTHTSADEDNLIGIGA